MTLRRESRFPRFLSHSRRALLSLAILFFGFSTGAHAIETSLNYELYDAVGNVKTLTTPRGTTTYTYDEIYRLTDEARPSAPPQHFNYDANGNRTSDGGGTLTYPPLKNRLDTRYGVTQTYDAAGNITNDGTYKYVYNAHGQLKQVTTQSGSEIASYKYDYRNRRSRKIAGGLTTVYHYDQWNRLIGESASSGTLQKSYVYRGNLPVAQIDHGSSAKVTYLHTDHLGTPREGRNSQQTVVWRWDSDAFGSTLANSDPDNDTAATTVNLRLPGQYFDSESGLSYNHNRYYVSKTGRYLQSDPIGLAGGANQFAYAVGNPVTYSDRDGRIAQYALPAIVIGIGLYQGVNAGDTFRTDFAEALKGGSQQDLVNAVRDIGVRGLVVGIAGKLLKASPLGFVGFGAGFAIGATGDAQADAAGLGGLLPGPGGMSSPDPVSDSIMRSFCEINPTARICQCP